jgi:hypothetical protein
MYRLTMVISAVGLLSGVVLAQQAATQPAESVTATRPAGQVGRETDQVGRQTDVGGTAQRQTRRDTEKAGRPSRLESLLLEGRRLESRVTRSIEGRHSVHGKIIDTRQVQIHGADKQHLLLKVRTTDGSTEIIDVGQREALGEHGQFSSGDWIAVSGVITQLNDRPIIVAEEFAHVTSVPREGDVFANILRGGGGQQNDRTTGGSAGR